MRRLLPVPSAPDEPIDLDAEYAYPPGRTWLRANMVSSLDGAAQGPEGLSEGLSSPADKRIFGVLRALSDVIVVGASTVRDEGYRAPRPRAAYAAAREAEGRLPVPVIAVVTRTLDLDFSSSLFTGALVPTVVIAPEDAPADRVERAAGCADLVLAGRGGVDFAAALDALAARGWTRQLTEGGPNVLAQITEAGRLDELCLALGPLLTAGPATRLLAGPPLTTVQRMRPALLLEEDDFLFARYVRD